MDSSEQGEGRSDAIVFHPMGRGDEGFELDEAVSYAAHGSPERVGIGFTVGTPHDLM